MSAPPLLTDETLVQITAPHFCAGAILNGGRVTRAAPILDWMQCQGVSLDFIRSYCLRKHWLLTIHHVDGSWEFAP